MAVIFDEVSATIESSEQPAQAAAPPGPHQEPDPRALQSNMRRLAEREARLHAD